MNDLIEKVHNVLNVLSLGKTELAKILGTNRQLIYAWVRLGGKLTTYYPSKLVQLSDLLTDPGIQGERPLYRQFVKEPLPGEAISIYDLLLSPSLDIERIRCLLHKAREYTSKQDDIMPQSLGSYMLRTIGHKHEVPVEAIL